MKHLFSINAEGGPLLLAEADVARQWKGTFEDGADYRTLCLAFDSNPQVPGMPFPVGNGKGIAWEVAGPGTADVFKGRDGEILVYSLGCLNQISEKSMEEGGITRRPGNECSYR